MVEIPDDLKNWPWWCSSDRSYCGASWAPTVSESTALADYLRDLGDTQCTLERAKGSKDDAYTIMAVINGHAKVGGFFTHLGDTDRAYKVSYPCLQLGYILYSLIEACQCNGRVVGKYYSVIILSQVKLTSLQAVHHCRIAGSLKVPCYSLVTKTHRRVELVRTRELESEFLLTLN